MGISSNHTLRETASRLAYQLETGQPHDAQELLHLLRMVAEGHKPLEPMMPPGHRDVVPQFRGD